MTRTQVSAESEGLVCVVYVAGPSSDGPCDRLTTSWFHTWLGFAEQLEATVTKGRGDGATTLVATAGGNIDVKEYRERTWRDLLAATNATTDTISVTLAQTEPGAVQAELVDLSVSRTLLYNDDSTYIELAANLQYPMQHAARLRAALVGSYFDTLAGADPLYGEMSLSEDGAPLPDAYLDRGLGRDWTRSLAEARTWLRGYSWVTVCPSQVLDRLGGMAGIEKSKVFTRIAPLAGGGVGLQAGADPIVYRQASIRQVFGALAPVLPRGLPKWSPGIGDSPEDPTPILLFQDAASISPTG